MAPQSLVNALVARGGGLHPPASVIASWPHPLVAEERGWATPIALAVILGITTIVVIARTWARVIVSKNAGTDGKHDPLRIFAPKRSPLMTRDLIMGLAMVPLYGLTIGTILGITKYGFQWHVWDQNLTTVVQARKMCMVIELLYLASTVPIKISILCFYRRITGSLTITFVYLTRGLIVFCAAIGIMFILLIIFTCSPVGDTFNVFDPFWSATHKAKCLNEAAIIVSCSVVSTIQDFVICMLPISLIWNLRITSRQRFALCMIFGMGTVTCICGIMRVYYATYVYYFTYDITWYSYYGWVWTVLEAQLGVICASLPALKVFFQRYFKVASSRKSSPNTSSCCTPGLSSIRMRCSPFVSKNPLETRSKLDVNKSQDSDTPFGVNKVARSPEIRVVAYDDISLATWVSTQTTSQNREEAASRNPATDLEKGTWRT